MARKFAIFHNQEGRLQSGWTCEKSSFTNWLNVESKINNITWKSQEIEFKKLSTRQKRALENISD